MPTFVEMDDRTALSTQNNDPPAQGFTTTLLLLLHCRATRMEA